MSLQHLTDLKFMGIDLLMFDFLHRNNFVISFGEVNLAIRSFRYLFDDFILFNHIKKQTNKKFIIQYVNPSAIRINDIG